jgi:SDR family mycofactocin-dependent oxidoreductase
MNGKVAFIPGAARGQGREHARVLAKHGADIALVDIADQIDTVPYPLGTSSDLRETAELVTQSGRRAIEIMADVRSLDAMQRAARQTVEELGRIDIVLGNAGIFSFAKHTWDLTEQQWDDVVDVDLKGCWTVAAAVIPHMLAGGNGGTIVFTSSVSGLKGVASTGHYVAAKHGLVGLMRTLAIELAPHRIRVNCVHPTAVRTTMSQNPAMQTCLEYQLDQGSNTMQNLLPVELLEPEDVSSAILWLVSDSARYVTGISLPVDAGFLIK